MVIWVHEFFVRLDVTPYVCSILHAPNSSFVFDFLHCLEWRIIIVLLSFQQQIVEYLFKFEISTPTTGFLIWNFWQVMIIQNNKHVMGLFSVFKLPQ
jgi:hypothetical protein